jgi:RNA polymerase sigma-70 factor (ECF subfamily)
MNHKASDDEIVELFKSGQLEVFEILVSRYYQQVKYYAERVLRYNAGDDVAQNTFLYLYERGINTYNPLKCKSFKSYLFMVAHSRAIDHKVSIYGRDFTRKWLNTDTVRLQDRGNLEGRVIAFQSVIAALSKLNERQRNVIQMVFFQDRTIPEIQEMMGENATQVRNHYYRGLSKMKQIMEDRDANNVHVRAYTYRKKKPSAIVPKLPPNETDVSKVVFFGEETDKEG